MKIGRIMGTGLTMVVVVAGLLFPQSVRAGNEAEQPGWWMNWDWRSNWRGGEDGVRYCYDTGFNGNTITGSDRIILMNSQRCLGGRTRAHKRVCTVDQVMVRRWDWSSRIGWEVYDCVDGNRWQQEMRQQWETRRISYCYQDNYFTNCKADYKSVPTLTPVPTAIPTIVPTAKPTGRPTMVPTKCPPTPTPKCYHRNGCGRTYYDDYGQGGGISAGADINNPVTASDSFGDGGCGWVTEYYQVNGGGSGFKKCLAV